MLSRRKEHHILNNFVSAAFVDGKIVKYEPHGLEHWARDSVIKRERTRTRLIFNAYFADALLTSDDWQKSNRTISIQNELTY